MDTLLTAMQARGFKVYAQPLEGHPDSDFKHVYLDVLGERLGLRLPVATMKCLVYTYALPKPGKFILVDSGKAAFWDVQA